MSLQMARPSSAESSPKRWTQPDRPQSIQISEDLRVHKESRRSGRELRIWSPNLGELEIPTLAKLTRPKLYEVVPRERLFGQLEAARGRYPAIWVVGPPGSGKTALVASYLDSNRIGGLWYQIDAGDNDIPTFFNPFSVMIPKQLPKP